MLPYAEETLWGRRVVGEQPAMESEYQTSCTHTIQSRPMIIRKPPEISFTSTPCHLFRHVKRRRSEVSSSRDCNGDSSLHEISGVGRIRSMHERLPIGYHGNSITTLVLRPNSFHPFSVVVWQRAAEISIVWQIGALSFRRVALRIGGLCFCRQSVDEDWRHFICVRIYYTVR